MSTSIARAVVLGTGVLVAAYGTYLLLGQGFDNLVATVLWLAGGVALHDGLLAPLVLLVCVLGARVLPRAWLGPAASGLLVLGSLTLVALPVLGRFGAREDNATLLDRDYWSGWLWLGAVVVGWVLLAGWLRSRRARGERD